jgi:hypothetical protein
VDGYDGPGKGTGPLTDERWSCRAYGDWHWGAHRRVAREITSLGREDMASQRGRRRVPGDRVWGRRHFVSERLAVDEEPNSGNANVIRRRGRDGDEAEHRCPGGRRGEETIPP